VFFSGRLGGASSRESVKYGVYGVAQLGWICVVNVAVDWGWSLWLLSCWRLLLWRSRAGLRLLDCLE